MLEKTYRNPELARRKLEYKHRLFEEWKEFMEDYTWVKVFNMPPGEKCKETWKDCTERQKALFDLWQEAVGQKHCQDNRSKYRKKNCPIFKKWLQMQKVFLKRWEYKIKMKRVEMMTEKHYESWFYIWFHIWFNIMHEALRPAVGNK